MSGDHAVDRRHAKNSLCKTRLEDGRSTHFIVGYNPMEFSSETQMKFKGDKKNDANVLPAGKTERNAAVKFKHVSMSENTLDLKAADPFTVNKQESLNARAAHRDPPVEHAFTTSVMKADYPALHQRGWELFFWFFLKIHTIIPVPNFKCLLKFIYISTYITNACIIYT